MKTKPDIDCSPCVDTNLGRTSIDARLSHAIQQLLRAKEQAKDCHEQLASIDNRANNRLAMIDAYGEVIAAQQKIDKIDAEKDSKKLVPRNRKSRRG